MARPIIITDLGFGDGGKGTVVDAWVRRENIELVCKYNGGAQAAHNVVLPDGRHHTFAQFGSGTFVPGVKTLLSRYVLFDPFALEREEEFLRKVGVTEVFTRLYVDERAKVVTPYHVAAGRLREISRSIERPGKHGSCGMGVGEAVRDYLYNPGVITAGDLIEGDSVKLRQKLAEIRSRLSWQIQELPGNLTKHEEYEVFEDPELVFTIAKRMETRVANVIPPDEANRMLREQSVIFEGAQGVLLDEDFGFHPYTTWSKTTARNAEALLEEAGVAERPLKVGVMRTYMTRHGNGPFPTEDRNLSGYLGEGEHNSFGIWQGDFRYGWLDLKLLSYARYANGGVDALAVTHVDKLKARDSWEVSTYYKANIPYPLPRSIKEQERMTSEMFKAVPVYQTVRRSFLLDIIQDAIGAPIALRSDGPTHKDKSWSI